MERLLRKKISWKIFLLGLIGVSGVHGSGSISARPALQEKRLHQFSREEQSALFIETMKLISEHHPEEIKPEILFKGALKGLLNMADAHSDFYDPDEYRDLCEHTKGEFGGLGMEVSKDKDGIPLIIAPIDDTPAALSGIKAGDLILAINGTPTQGMSLSESVKKMRGAPGTKVVLLIKRENSKPFSLTVRRAIISIKSVKWRIDGDVGYLRISTFDEKTTELLIHAIKEIQKTLGNRQKGWVVDVRNNPGGLLDQAISVVNCFVGEGIIVSTKGRRPESNSVSMAIPGKVIVGSLPVVLLINEGSASASEIMAGALQDHGKALLLGKPTFGKGSVQRVIPLSDGKDGGIKLTIARFYTPLGHPIQGHGIKPDVWIEPRVLAEAQAPIFELREKDLAGSLAAEKQAPELDAKSTKGAIATPSQLAKKTEDNTEADFQLQRALDTVRALYVFFYKSKHKPTVPGNVELPTKQLLFRMGK